MATCLKSVNAFPKKPAMWVYKFTLAACVALATSRERSAWKRKLLSAQHLQPEVSIFPGADGVSEQRAVALETYGVSEQGDVAFESYDSGSLDETQSADALEHRAGIPRRTIANTAPSFVQVSSADSDDDSTSANAEDLDDNLEVVSGCDDANTDCETPNRAEPNTEVVSGCDDATKDCESSQDLTEDPASATAVASGCDDDAVDCEPAVGSGSIPSPTDIVSGCDDATVDCTAADDTPSSNDIIDDSSNGKEPPIVAESQEAVASGNGAEEPNQESDDHALKLQKLHEALEAPFDHQHPRLRGSLSSKTDAEDAEVSGASDEASKVEDSAPDDAGIDPEVDADAADVTLSDDSAADAAADGEQ